MLRPGRKAHTSREYMLKPANMSRPYRAGYKTIALTWENRSMDTAEQNSSSAANPITIRFMSPPRPVNNFCVAYTAWRSRSIGWRRFLAADCADDADGL